MCSFYLFGINGSNDLTFRGEYSDSWFWHCLTCASSTQVSNCMSTYGDIASVPFFSDLSEENKTAVRVHFGS